MHAWVKLENALPAAYPGVCRSEFNGVVDNHRARPPGDNSFRYRRLVAAGGRTEIRCANIARPRDVRGDHLLRNSRRHKTVIQTATVAPRFDGGGSKFSQKIQTVTVTQQMIFPGLQ